MRIARVLLKAKILKVLKYGYYISIKFNVRLTKTRGMNL